MYLYTLPSLANILLGGTRFSLGLEGLARRCRMQPDQLAVTVRAFNAAAATGCDPLGKSPGNVAPFGHGPYFAINMDLDNRFTVTMLFTLGGLSVDERSGAITRKDGSAVPGLYAAGRTAVGLCSRGYISGMSIADTVFSGRRAARDAVARQKAKQPHTALQSN